MTRKLTHPELLARQEGPRKTIPLTVVVNNVRSLYNVGSIFRTADGVGVEKLWLCGITGIPPSNQISKTALDAEKVVPWEYAEHAAQSIRQLKKQGYKIVLLEQCTESIAYEKFKPEGPVCLVLGNEVEGVSEDLVSLCDATIEIGMAGLKNSLNVTVAFGIVAYHLSHSLPGAPADLK